MALANDRATRNSNSQSSLDGSQGGPPLQGFFDPSPLEFFGFKGHSDPFETYPIGYPPTLSDSSNSSTSNGYMFRSPMQEALTFKSSADHRGYSSSSVLSFEQGDRASRASYSKLDQEEECASWIDAIDHDCQLNHLNLKCGTSSRLAQDANCYEMASGYGSMIGGSAMNDNHRHGEERFGLLYSDADDVDGLQEGERQEIGSQKRRHMLVDDMEASKKHCVNGRKSKAKPIPPKDPQGIAAKNRRERISERLKVLQELVPNGTKVDMVTMLEKAISYVKFLQLQVKVLATDELWPTQGGKAPEVTQVKEAIDSILASHRERNSSSKQ